MSFMFSCPRKVDLLRRADAEAFLKFLCVDLEPEAWKLPSPAVNVNEFFWTGGIIDEYGSYHPPE